MAENSGTTNKLELVMKIISIVGGAVSIVLGVYSYVFLNNSDLINFILPFYYM